jgi:hypothetical protein
MCKLKVCISIAASVMPQNFWREIKAAIQRGLAGIPNAFSMFAGDAVQGRLFVADF